VEHGLDVVAIGIEGEGRVVAGMIGALSGAAIVAPAMGKGGLVEGVNAFPIFGLKREMDLETGPSALSIQSSSQEKCCGLSEVKSCPRAFRTAR
jgi:hypothetical protein